MKIPAQPTVTVVLLAFLAACGGNNALQPPPSRGASAALGFPFLALPGTAARHGSALGSHPLLHPNPCCVQTLFVSDGGTNQVQLFKFPNGNYVGSLPQPPETFSAPAGECVDTTNPQHVFVTNEGMSTIDEYTHGGAYVMHLADPGEGPLSCAYRQTGPNSALLAVGNHFTGMGGSGSISMYAETAGVWSGPTIYTPPAFLLVGFVAYKGNTLFLDGYAAGAFEFSSMSPGGTFTLIPLSHAPCTINAPGGVQHINGYLAVGDQIPSAGCPNIYWVSRPAQSWLDDSVSLTLRPRAVLSQGFEDRCADSFGSADIYSYPNGALITPVTSPLVGPIGSAVSHQ